MYCAQVTFSVFPGQILRAEVKEPIQVPERSAVVETRQILSNRRLTNLVQNLTTNVSFQR